MIGPDNACYHLDALTALEDADLALARSEHLVSDEPHTLGAVTREWVQTALGNTVSGAELLSLTAGAGHDGMTERRKWRLAWNGAGQQAGLPENIFVKATPADVEHRVLLSVQHMGFIEVNFYNQIRAEIPEITPRSYFGRAYAGGRYILVMEDIEERGLRPFWMADSCTIDHARAVGSAMAQYHAKFWESPRFERDLAWLRPRSRRYGRFWRASGMREDRIAFLKTSYAADMPEALRQLARAYNESVLDLYDYYDSLPCTLVHGDSHLANTFATADGGAGMYDWQLAFRCSGLRDYAYFIYSALPLHDRQLHERSLFAEYLDGLESRGVSLDRQNAWETYCLMILERWDAVIKSTLHGFYGHAREAYMRQAESIHAGLIEHDVAALLRHALARR